LKNSRKKGSVSPISGENCLMKLGQEKERTKKSTLVC